VPVAVQAGLWGLLAGGALVVGAAIAWVIQVPQKVVAGVMAFGAGVLISALAFDLVDEAEATGGLAATIVGFLAGATVYVTANVLLDKRGARHRKRSGEQQPSEQEQDGSGAAIAIGASSTASPSRSSWACRSWVATASASRCWPRSSSPTCPKGSPRLPG
jgi:ZIP family zinc transporter